MKLEVLGIDKSFGTNAVLRGVDLTVSSGEVVALVGENGAGKSTLTRVIAGVYQPDGGTVSIDGVPVAIHRPQDAMNHGIRVIYQEFRHNLFPHLTVAENMFVREDGASHGRVFVSKRTMAVDAKRILADIGLDIDPRAQVSQLSVAEQQMIEIAKAISHNVELLILDEPTAALDDRESEQLFAQIRRLRQAGTAIVYISHRLDEVFALADRIVVLRDGRVALSSATADTSSAAVVAAMVGRTVDDFYPKEDNRTDGPPVLTASGLTSPDQFEDVTFEVRPGEVLGLAGVLGSGRGEVLRALFGLERISTGDVRVSGRVVDLRRPTDAIRAGVSYMVPDRGESGLCPQLSVSANISLAALSRLTHRFGMVNRAAERRSVRDLVKQLLIRTASVDLPVNALSGGNQQKVLFGKWLLTDPRVLLMEEPTRGVDVGAKAEIYRIMNDLTRAGVAIVIVSSDLPELVAMSDRVLVMRAGRVVHELTGADINQANILTQALEVA
jgi:ABC-type sugar transport system ATPase subunit